MAETTIQGLKAAKAAFQAMPAVMRDQLNDATETTVREIARQAQINLLRNPSIETRALYNAVGLTMNRRSGRGRAGIGTGSTHWLALGMSSRAARARLTPSRRGHFVEFGTVKMAAEPFMVPAAESEKLHYLARCHAAGRKAERDLAAIGMRNL